jgi:RNA polymerase sigma-70 factor (ECF subfamily)
VDPVDFLFRHEAGRMVAVLTRIFGVHHLALVEDVVQDAFCHALEVWQFHGLPENPAAWLMTCAKHRAIDVLRRERTADRFATELGGLADSEWTLVPAVEERFSPETREHDLLRVMFWCCDPRIKDEGQVAIILNVVCGFSAREVAGALVSGLAATEKRIVRGKKILADSGRLFEVSNLDEFSARLPVVQRALYLLFNEGYHGASAESAVREELCREAIRLVILLQQHPRGDTPVTRVLRALMCLHAARLPSRLNAEGELLSLFHQDRTRWDRSLIEEGSRWLEEAASGDELTDYHLEAAIAWVHASAASAEETDWGRIVMLYDRLMGVRPSPVVALNRAIAIAQIQGPERGLEEVRSIGDIEKLASYPFYPAALGELELRCGRNRAARECFQAAVKLARNPSERRYFEQRVQACGRRGVSEARARAR